MACLRRVLRLYSMVELVQCQQWGLAPTRLTVITPKTVSALFIRASRQALQASEAANAGPGHEGEDDAHTNGRASSTAHEGRGNSRPDSPSREGAAGEDGAEEGSRCGSARAGKAKAADQAGVVAQLERRLGLLESQAHSMLEEIADIRDTLEGLNAEQGPGAA